ncbi:NAD(P)H-dependent oxidoreductase [Paenibacillus sp. NPDC057886]|uniref:NAD(P)H-dependent oxidoreductase n=1 Tax=Paenibacillus sp. NPDC057886 TaxID=3346270 RepID=UPI0036904BF3
MNIYIVFDSEGGHTRALAESIAAGAASVHGATVHLHSTEEADIYKLVEMDAIIWGCPGHFGSISSSLKKWIDKLGYLWAEGKLVDKVGAVFCTIATEHGGLESTLIHLLTPMLHQGMIITGLPGNFADNALYGSYYGVGVTCPVDSDDLLSEQGMALGKALGERVARITNRLIT